MIQFDARVDTVLACMDPVFAHVNPVFSFPWKRKEVLPKTLGSVKGNLPAVTKISVLRLD